ncbi:NADP(H)-dependent aldo-keto reductase [Ulvibacter litoralis]|uniref:Protein tas n=1 Tax=Ulvibacter litoralis TaxID=227084 RepID=A0A1G7CWF1_9FLAO|nr:NADP(H)-dependent aldo-keto reductase [Ulvibacter litoralis]GHC45808.1 aldo/keto reductase [Ulvibacter litoralis]SDE43638.1 Predicted oxidoreductase [Ulvibacter litoralis]
MKYTKLPNTDLDVSEICLGTMTFGQQNTEQEAHEQLNFAFDKGVNFIDTAEMYAAPASKETQGLTEKFIGTWLAKTGQRENVVLASKIAGPSRGFAYLRDSLDFSKASLEDALHKSLKRLQTDYLDLYQLHWPERAVNIFGVREYDHSENEAWKDNFSEVIERLESFVKEGKIKHIGLSNETPYGLMRYMEESRKGATKMVSVQNAYNLLNRRDEIGLSEVLLQENVGYLPYSPLAFGQLTGKYLNGATPSDARVTLFPNYVRYHGEGSFEAIRAYNDIAKKHELSLAQLSLAFVRQQDFVTSTIIGATKMQQLSENIESVHVTLSEEILKEINQVHARIPNPAS